MKSTTEILTIYTPDGTPFFSVLVGESSILRVNLMSEDNITLTFSTDTPYRIQRGYYTYVKSSKPNTLPKKYVICEPSFPVYNQANGGYDYNIRLDAWYYNWNRYKFSLNPQFGAIQTTFNYTQKLPEHLRLVFLQLKEIRKRDLSIDLPTAFVLHYNGKTEYWSYGTDLIVEDEDAIVRPASFLTDTNKAQTANIIVETGELDDTDFKCIYTYETPIVPDTSNDATFLIKDELKLVSYDGLGVIDAIGAMCAEEAFNCEWWVDDSNMIHFGRCEYGDTLVLRTHEELSNLTRSNSSNEYATKIIAFGSNRNIPSRYRKKLLFNITETEHINAKGVSDSNQTQRTGTITSTSETFNGLITLVAPCNNPSVQFRIVGNFGDEIGSGTFHIYENGKNQGSIVISYEGSSTQFNKVFSYQSNLKKGENAIYTVVLSRSNMVELSYTFTFVSIMTGVIPAYNRLLDANRKLLPTYFSSGKTYEYKYEYPFTDGTHGNIYGWVGYVVGMPKGKVYIRFKGECDGNVWLTYGSNRLDIGTVIPDKVYEIYLESEVIIYLRSESSIVTRGFSMKGEAGNFRVDTKLYLEDGREFDCVINPEIEQVDTIKGCDVIYYTDIPVTIGSQFHFEDDALDHDKIPLSYYTDDYKVDENIASYSRRLMLPESCEGNAIVSNKAKDSQGNVIQSEIVEIVKVFDDIYPSKELTITDVDTYPGYKEIIDDDGKKETIDVERFRFWVNDGDHGGITFKQKYITNGNNLECIFQTGLVAGFTFQLEFDYTDKDHPGKQAYRIINNDSTGVDIPNPALIPKPGDKVVLLNYNPMSLTDMGFVTEAENRLKERAMAELDKLSYDAATYTAEVFSDIAQEAINNGEGLPELGQKVELHDEVYFIEPRNTRVIGYERHLDIPYDSPTITLGESLRYSRLKSIEKQINK